METILPKALTLAAELRAGKWTPNILQNESALRDRAATELRRQHAEIETLRAGYDAARLEIESLRERVQQLGQLARDVNSRRVTELEAQLAAVQQDAERWQFFADYMVSTRTDLDDEIVGCDSVQKMAMVFDAARAAQEGKHD